MNNFYIQHLFIKSIRPAAFIKIILSSYLNTWESTTSVFVSPHDLGADRQSLHFFFEVTHGVLRVRCRSLSMLLRLPGCCVLVEGSGGGKRCRLVYHVERTVRGKIAGRSFSSFQFGFVKFVMWSCGCCSHVFGAFYVYAHAFRRSFCPPFFFVPK